MRHLPIIPGTCISFTAIFVKDVGCVEPRTWPENAPDSAEKVNTRFFLYTKWNIRSRMMHRSMMSSLSIRNNPNDAGQAITASNLGHFNSSKDIKVIIHGFTDKASNPWVLSMKNELLKSVRESVYPRLNKLSLCLTVGRLQCRCCGLDITYKAFDPLL